MDFFDLSLYTLFIIAVALIFDFLNGVNDAANAVATIVSTKVLKPFHAVALSSFFNFAAVFGFPLAVAMTIGKGIITPEIVTPHLILGALLGAIVWTYTATHFGIPISVSHALIGGLIGSAIAAAGWGTVILGMKMFLIIAFIALSPMIGMGVAFLFMAGTLRLLRKKPLRRIDKWYRRLQLISASAFSFGHGTNDAQKTMGIVTALLFSVGYFGSDPTNITIPYWVIISCYSAIALGTLIGGFKVVKTMGQKLTKLRPVHGFCAETSGAMTVIGCSLIGIPVSTTHTITGSILGVGATRSAKKVKWGVARRIIWAWVITIPCAALVGALSYGVVYFIATTFF